MLETLVLGARRSWWQLEDQAEAAARACDDAVLETSCFGFRFIHVDGTDTEGTEQAGGRGAKQELNPLFHVPGTLAAPAAEDARPEWESLDALIESFSQAAQVRPNPFNCQRAKGCLLHRR